MPVYLDRHDLTDGVDAEHVAKIHMEDLKLQDRYGCKALTYWFDYNRKTGYCLFEAPNENAINDLHAHAHGGVPTTIIEVNENVVKSFLGRITDPEKKENVSLNIIDDAAFRTILIIKFQYKNLNDKFSSSCENKLNELNVFLNNEITNYKGSTVNTYPPSTFSALVVEYKIGVSLPASP